MSDPLVDVTAAALSSAPVSQFRFCAVTASTSNVSITVNFGGTSVVIPRVRIYTHTAWPVVTDWVAVGVVGSDTFVLGIRH
jgi:hypothetical protein